MQTAAARDWPGSLERRFEAFLVDWEGTAVPDRHADATEIKRLVEALCALGAEIAVTSDAPLGDVDGQLQARPMGPGSLHLLLNRGSEVVKVDGGGPQLVWLRQGSAAEGAAGWFLSYLWIRGIGPGLVLIAGDEMGTLGGTAGSDSRLLVPKASRAAAVSVGSESEGVPRQVLRLGGGPPALERLLRDQLRRRVEREVPSIDATSDWGLTIDGFDPTLERAHEALLTLADGRCGTSGAPPLRQAACEPRTLVAGTYTPDGGETELLHAPVWNQLHRSMPRHASASPAEAGRWRELSLPPAELADRDPAPP